jgi:cytochrome b pre-mRNA-processing protein 3
LPVFYSDYHVPDTFEGRFELLTLHAALALRQLRAKDAKGTAMAQDLVDAVFRHFDRALREIGVGDLSVGKRIKTMAAAFLGRATAYEEALRSGTPEALDQALERNVRGTGNAPGDQARALGAYARALDAAFSTAPVERFVAADLPFPDPARFLMEAAS